MLRFLIFTACRTNEVVGARWSEIDRPSSTWRIPGERMKMHQDHVVPLSDPALAILDKMRGGQRELIFPNPEGGAFLRMPCSPCWTLRLRSRYRAWNPLDLRNLGRRMHRLSRWRPRGSARPQVQIGDHGGLSARAGRREAALPHERLGAIPQQDQMSSASTKPVSLSGQLSLRSVHDRSTGLLVLSDGLSPVSRSRRFWR